MLWRASGIRYHVRERNTDGTMVACKVAGAIGYGRLGRLTHLNFRAYHLRLGISLGTLLLGRPKNFMERLGATISKNSGSIDLWIRKNWNHSKSAWRRGSRICAAPSIVLRP